MSLKSTEHLRVLPEAPGVAYYLNGRQLHGCSVSHEALRQGGELLVEVDAESLAGLGLGPLSQHR